MKIVAQIVSPDGKPLKKGSAALVQASERGPQKFADATIVSGQLSFDAEPGATWGLTIEDKPILAPVKQATTKAIDLGELVLLSEALPIETFHAPDGLVYGVPKSLYQAWSKATSSAPTGAGTTPDPTPSKLDAERVTQGMTFAAALGSTARQLNDAVLTGTSINLASARVTLKGIPTAADNAIGLEFPSAELIKSGIGLSELTFSVETKTPALPPTSPQLPATLNLTGYTAELAQRKAQGQGFIVELNTEAVTDPAQHGRVVRQSPAAGTRSSPNTVMHLYIGKSVGAR